MSSTYLVHTVSGESAFIFNFGVWTGTSVAIGPWHYLTTILKVGFYGGQTIQTLSLTCGFYSGHGCAPVFK